MKNKRRSQWPESVLQKAREQMRQRGETPLPEAENAHKFGAQAVVVDGIRFASKAEGRRYEYLKNRAQKGEIKDLVLQEKYVLRGANGQQVSTYAADFSYTLVSTGEKVVEDVKGVETEAFRIKKRWLLADHGVKLKLVKKRPKLTADELFESLRGTAVTRKGQID